MACYSNKVKLMCSRVVAAISVLLFLIGIVTVVIGVGAGNTEMLPKSMQEKFADNPSIKKGFAVFSTIIMILGIIMVIVSFLGCGAAKLKKPFLAIPFGLLGLIMAVVLIPVGSLSVAGGTQVMTNFNRAFRQNCKSEMDVYSQLSNIMCSKDCPCDPALKGDWGLFTMGDAKLADYKRTVKRYPSSAQKKKGITPIVFAPRGKGYKLLSKCIEDKQSKNSNFMDKSQNEAKNILMEMEKQFDCAGIC